MSGSTYNDTHNDTQQLYARLQNLLEEQQITITHLKSEINRLESALLPAVAQPQAEPARLGRRRMLGRLGAAVLAGGLAVAAAPRLTQAKIEYRPKAYIGLLTKLSADKIEGDKSSPQGYGLVAIASYNNVEFDLSKLPDLPTGVFAASYRGIVARSENETAVYGFSQTGNGLRCKATYPTGFGQAIFTQHPSNKEALRGTSVNGPGIVAESVTCAPVLMYPKDAPVIANFTPVAGDMYLDLNKDLWLWQTSQSFTGWRRVKYV